MKDDSVEASFFMIRYCRPIKVKMLSVYSIIIFLSTSIYILNVSFVENSNFYRPNFVSQSNVGAKILGREIWILYFRSFLFHNHFASLWSSNTKEWREVKKPLSLCVLRARNLFYSFRRSDLLFLHWFRSTAINWYLYRFFFRHCKTYDGKFHRNVAGSI